MVSSKNFKYKKWAEKINPPQHLTKNRKKVPYLTTKTPIHSSLTPASNLVHNLNQAAYHRLKDA